MAKQTGAVLRFVELGPDETLTADGFRAVIGPKTRLVSVAHVSNTLGAAPHPAAPFVPFCVTLSCVRSPVHLSQANAFDYTLSVPSKV